MSICKKRCKNIENIHNLKRYLENRRLFLLNSSKYAKIVIVNRVACKCEEIYVRNENKYEKNNVEE